MAEAISLTNTGLPLVVLAGLALGLPRIIVSRECRSQAVLMRATATTAIGVFAAGIAIFAGLQMVRGADVVGAIGVSPLGTFLGFAKSSALTALFWAPILALNWMGMAQAINRRLGEDVAREGRGGNS